MNRLTPTLLLLTVCHLANAQSRPVVVLDPARGGAEAGAHFPDGTLEKKVTLDLATRLRFLLQARGFDVVLTRDGDVSVDNNQRAATANTAHPIACLLLHASTAGTGVHLYNSALKPADSIAGPVPWGLAQAPYVSRSLRLTNELTTALTRSRIPVSAGLTWVHPLDDMQCSAVALELGPKRNGTAATDAEYQTQVADALAGALLAWRGHADASGHVETSSHADAAGSTQP